MKKITVPSNWGNPLIIDINTGNKVILEAGKTVEVEDEVASIIEDALANLPKESTGIPIDEAVKAYIDSLIYHEKLTLTNETAKKVLWKGIEGNASYIKEDNAVVIQIAALVKGYSEDWKIEPLGENNEKFDDFIACGYTSTDEGEEPEYFEFTKANLDEQLNIPFYTGQYSDYLRWCGIKWMYGQCFFGYSNAWDFTSYIQNLETEEEKQDFIKEIEELVSEMNTDFANFSFDSISIIRTVQNLTLKERTVS